MNAPELWRSLYEIDRLEAELVGARPCPYCGGKLQRCDYQRKPRGIAEDTPTELLFRFSFCCGGCRRRVTPLSARFLGRKVYVAAVVVLEAALRQVQRPAEAFERVFAVSSATAQRWVKWWRTVVPGSKFWMVARASFMPSLSERTLAASLLRVFLPERDCVGGLVKLLKFISPLGHISPRTC